MTSFVSAFSNAAVRMRSTPSADVWFAGGEHIGYDPKARVTVQAEDAPLEVFLKTRG
jgi:hypothetical protein